MVIGEPCRNAKARDCRNVFRPGAPASLLAASGQERRQSQIRVGEL